MRIGLLGGSFNPPHDGHLHISLAALRLLKLDAVWWLVSPGNPLKDPAQNAPYAERLDMCARMTAPHPRIVTSDLEDQLGTARTVETLSALLPRFPATDFVFLMGMDNSAQFHKWHRWQDIADMIALAHFPRPPYGRTAPPGPLRSYEGVQHYIVRRPEAVLLAPRQNYWITGGRMMDISSTALRAAAQQPQK